MIFFFFGLYVELDGQKGKKKKTYQGRKMPLIPDQGSAEQHCRAYWQFTRAITSSAFC